MTDDQIYYLVMSSWLIPSWVLMALGARRRSETIVGLALLWPIALVVLAVIWPGLLFWKKS